MASNENNLIQAVNYHKCIQFKFESCLFDMMILEFDVTNNGGRDNRLDYCF